MSLPAPPKERRRNRPTPQDLVIIRADHRQAHLSECSRVDLRVRENLRLSDGITSGSSYQPAMRPCPPPALTVMSKSVPSRDTEISSERMSGSNTMLA